MTNRITVGTLRKAIAAHNRSAAPNKMIRSFSYPGVSSGLSIAAAGELLRGRSGSTAEIFASTAARLIERLGVVDEPKYRASDQIAIDREAIGFDSAVAIHETDLGAQLNPKVQTTED